MSQLHKRPPTRRWAVLLALPLLCCVGHAVLLALGVGSVATVAGALSGSAALVVTGIVLAVAAVAGLVLRRGRR